MVGFESQRGCPEAPLWETEWERWGLLISSEWIRTRAARLGAEGALSLRTDTLLRQTAVKKKLIITSRLSKQKNNKGNKWLEPYETRLLFLHASCIRVKVHPTRLSPLFTYFLCSRQIQTAKHSTLTMRYLPSFKYFIPLLSSFYSLPSSFLLLIIIIIIIIITFCNSN